MSENVERPFSWFNEEEDGSGVVGYMCLVDFECELGAAMGGNGVYPSVEDLKANRKCVEGCGIVEVRVVGVRVVQPGRDGVEDE